MTNQLSNSKASIVFTGLCIDIQKDKPIDGKEDQNNLPAFYTTRKRGLKKAWEILVEKFTEETTMYDAINILHNEKIFVQSYYVMD